MVESFETHSRRAPAFYLVFLLILIAALSGCEKTPERTIVQLHFKTGEQVEPLLTHLIDETIKYQVIGNSVVFDANKEDLKPTLKILETLDTPPISYELELTPKNIINYSTRHTPKSIFLVEGKTTTTEINGTTLQITANKANQNQSLLHVLSKNRKDEISENYWLIPHNRKANPEPRIFPRGLTLRVQK